MATGDHHFISVQPNDLKFVFELEKQSICDVKLVNNTEHSVAFKVKTTSPKKYFVRPNTNVIPPWDSCTIRVTLQAQHEYPPDMQCKDKFLLQSTMVPAHIDVDELPQDTFNKESGKAIQELKLRVLYVSPSSAAAQGDQSRDREIISADSDPSIQSLRNERDEAVRQTAALRQELETLHRRRSRGNDGGFSLPFAALVGLIGILVGFLLNLSLSSPSPAAE